MTERQAENAALINVMKEFATPTLIELEHPEKADDKVQILAEPHGGLLSIKSFVDEWRTRPDSLHGTAELHDLESFIQHVQAFSKGKEETALFADADRSGPSLTAIYDYQTSEKPSFAHHRACYSFELSDQWNAWIAVSGQPLKQAAFAHFLESHLEDILSPDSVGEKNLTFLRSLSYAPCGPNKVLELSQGLSISVNSKVTQRIDTQTGERELTFLEEHRDSSNVHKSTVPNAFVIGIPVFLLGDAYQIAVRIQYRLEAGSVVWFLTPMRTEVVFDAAFRGACEQAKERTDLPLFYGVDEKAK